MNRVYILLISYCQKMYKMWSLCKYLAGIFVHILLLQFYYVIAIAENVQNYETRAKCKGFLICKFLAMFNFNSF